jgi:hypothetical protein
MLFLVSCGDEQSTSPENGIEIETKFEIINMADALTIILEGTDYNQLSDSTCNFTKNTVSINIKVIEYTAGEALFTLKDSTIVLPGESEIIYSKQIDQNMDITASTGIPTNFSISSENFTGKIRIDAIGQQTL